MMSLAKTPITKRQKDLLEILYHYIKTSGYPPTFLEMREALGVLSNQSVIDHLTQLQERGYIKREGAGARKIALLPRAYEILKENPLVPFLGTTTAGFPAEAIEIEGEWQTISKTATEEISRLSDEVFLLKVNGDSMIGVGIYNGAMVLVQHKKEFSSGDIVLAYVDEEATIKRFISQDKPPYRFLKPENPRYNIILFEDNVEMKGVVLGVVDNERWKFF